MWVVDAGCPREDTFDFRFRYIERFFLRRLVLLPRKVTGLNLKPDRLHNDSTMFTHSVNIFLFSSIPLKKHRSARMLNFSQGMES